MLRPKFSITLIFWCLTFFVVGVCIFLEFLIPANGDETHFCHAAWLSQHGQAPFADFLYHNSPAIIDLLNLGSLLGTEYLAESLFFGRFLCSVSIFCLAWLFFKLGHELQQRWFGHFACWLYFPLGMLPYSMDFKKNHFCIRPEVLALPMTLYVLLVLIRWRRTEKPPGIYSTVASGILAALTFIITLRLFPVYFGIIGFFISRVFRRQKLSWQLPAAAMLAILLVAAYYGFYVGVANTKTWILQYSSLLREPGLGVLGWFRANPGKFVVTAALIAVVNNFVRAPKIEPVLWITFLSTLAGPFFETSPGFPAWQMPILLGALILASYLCLEKERYAQRKITWLVPAMIALCVLYPVRRLPLVTYQLITQPEYSLSAQVDIYNQMNRMTGSDYMTFVIRGNPIAVKDPSYYWTQFLRLAIVIPKIDAPPLTLLEDLLRLKPSIVHELPIRQAYPEIKSLSDTKLAEFYKPLVRGYWLRADIEAQPYLKILESPAGIVHFVAE